jgi:hypothetical protein
MQRGLQTKGVLYLGSFATICGVYCSKVQMHQLVTMVRPVWIAHALPLSSLGCNLNHYPCNVQLYAPECFGSGVSEHAPIAGAYWAGISVA